MEIYIAKIEDFKDLRGAEQLPDARLKKVYRYRFWQDKARCLVAELLLQKALGRNFRDEWAIGMHGKPYLKNTCCHFNLSHSGEYVVLGVSNVEIGVDVEQIAPFPWEMAERCFTPAELECLKQQGKDASFYALWTAKESIMKATGLGLSLQPHQFEVLPLDAETCCVQGRTWHLYHHSLEGHELCAAIECRQPDVRILQMGREELLGGIV